MLKVLQEHSATGIGRFQECAQKYYYEYVDRYEPIVKSTALKAGTITHIGQESYWNGHNLEAALECMDSETKENGWHEDPLFLPKVRSYIKGYYHRWETNDKLLSDRYEVLGVEEGFTYPSGVDGALLAGKIDVVLYDKEEDITILLEHKGTSNLLAQDIGSSYWDMLGMNTQLYIYADYLIKKYNRPVQALWDVTITSPKSRPAQKSKIGKRKSESAEEWAYRKVQNMETIEEFEKRLTETYINTPDKFIRKRIPILNHRLERKMGEIRTVIGQMQSDFDPIRNTNACSSFGGCAYLDICLGYGTLEESKRFKKRIKPNKKVKFKNPLPF